ncbi:MAG: hypothetical protein CMJ78_11330 [Planctomycetaceae bacterium]|nr:hypothetical protein [Planctomycetaceae bacterium]
MLAAIYRVCVVDGIWIAFNGQDGVKVLNNGTRNTIRGKSIANNQLAFDLNNDGVTPNDALDVDTGANDLTNFPTIQTVTSSGGITNVVGTISAASNTSYSLDFYSNSELDSTQHGEGRTCVGSTNVTTDGSGNAAYDVNFATSLPSFEFVNGTATSSSASTSEFSLPARVNVTEPNIELLDTYLINGAGDRANPVLGEEVDVRVEFRTEQLAVDAEYVIRVTVDGVELDSEPLMWGARLAYGTWFYEVER